MKTENAIVEYWNEIRTGGVVVGKWIRMLYDVLMQGISECRWFFDDRQAVLRDPVPHLIDQSGLLRVDPRRFDEVLFLFDLVDLPESDHLPVKRRRR